MKSQAEVREIALYTADEAEAAANLAEAFETSPLSTSLKLRAFPRYARRQDMARFLARTELFRRCLQVHGSIVECGVFTGFGVFSWLQLSAIFEPYNFTSEIIGFDTFSGYPDVHDKDVRTGTSEYLRPGGFAVPAGARAELEALAAVHDRNRPGGHIEKLRLIEGDASRTIPAFVEENPQLLLRMLYLDFGLYESTAVAMDHLLPRLVSGGVLAFQNLNSARYPGETLALLERCGIADMQLRRFEYTPAISYCVRR